MKRLKTSQPYSLYQLFFSELETNGKIVIPDLQRDYCWGNDSQLVPSFLSSLINEFQTRPNRDVIMGLIYGYYENTRPNLLLCDGQQRLTTLFLLIGLLYRYTQFPQLKNMLMSEFERESDDLEPRLIYDIRETSKYFLSELVTNVFYSVGDIEEDKSDNNNMLKGWWKKAYKLDPSISSMIIAVNYIVAALSEIQDLTDFAHFVINRLKFLFYDMGERKAGEETFVIINTSGEPLTASENLKPVILSKYGNESHTSGDIWEIIDNWFWRNRDKKNEDTSDSGMNEFLRRVTAINSRETENYYKIFDEGGELFIKLLADPVANMKEYHTVFKALYEDSFFREQCPLFNLPLSKQLDLNEYFVILPTISFALKFKQTLLEDNKISIIRAYRFFENISRYTIISRENNNIRLALDAVSKMPNADICSLLDIAKDINNTYILTAEEKLKLEILRSLNKADRLRIENAFWNLQSNNRSNGVWNGEISLVIAWATHDNRFSTEDFIKYEQVLDYLFGIERDKLRRLLLTLKLDNYPVYINSAYCCFINSDKDFLPVIERNNDKLLTLLQDLTRYKDKDEMKARINHYIDTFPVKSDWSEFVHCPYLLQYMNQKNMWHDENRGWLLYKNAYARPFSTMNAHLLYALGGSFAEWSNLKECDFMVHYYANARDVDCVVVKNNTLKIEFDIYLSLNSCDIRIHHTEGKPLENKLKYLGFSTEGDHLIKSIEVADGKHDYGELSCFIIKLAQASNKLSI